VQLLTVSDAAKRLALDSETVRRYLRTGAINGVLVGRYWRIEETELTAYVERLKAAQTS